ncbi:MAG: hypothetical protein PVH88_18495 [Ignavibacteria bacterium]|jgi:peptidoglycan/LPS O-acetylase OafA/YrhL
MNVNNNILIPVIVLSVISLVIGIILTVKGSPYNNVLSTLYKICSFAIGILFCFIFYNNMRHNNPAMVTKVFAIACIIFFVVSVINGSILISSENVNPVIKISHRISSVGTYVLGMVAIVF